MTRLTSPRIALALLLFPVAASLGGIAASAQGAGGVTLGPGPDGHR